MFYLGPIQRLDASATNKLNKERRYVKALSDTAASAPVDDDTREQSASCDDGWPTYERRQKERRVSIRPPLLDTRTTRNRRMLSNPHIDIHV